MCEYLHVHTHVYVCVRVRVCGNLGGSESVDSMKCLFGCLYEKHMHTYANGYHIYMHLVHT